MTGWDRRRDALQLRCCGDTDLSAGHTHQQRARLGDDLLGVHARHIGRANAARGSEAPGIVFSRDCNRLEEDVPISKGSQLETRQPRDATAGVLLAPFLP